MPLKHFNPDDSIDLWWAGDQVRLLERSTNEKQTHSSESESEESDANQDDLLEDWDDLIMDEASNNDTTEFD